MLAELSASALHGAKYVDSDDPAVLVHTNRRPPGQLVVRSDTLLPGECQLIDGMPATTPARTAFDLGRRLNLTAGVQRIDALMNATDVKVNEIEPLRCAIRASEACGSCAKRWISWPAALSRRMSLLLGFY